MYDYATCQCGRNAYYEDMKGCKKDKCECMAKMPYAMAFVKTQCNPRMFNPAEALCKGTMFPDLHSPHTY